MWDDKTWTVTFVSLLAVLSMSVLPTNEAAAQQGSGTVTVSGEVVNVRAVPAADGTVVFKVKHEDVLQLIEDKGDWLFVEGPGARRGYVRSTLVQKVPHSRDGAANGTSAGAKVATFGNADIVSLVEIKLGDSVILSKIEQAPNASFDLSTDGLVALKKASVSDEVIQAMLRRSTGGVVAPNPNAPAVRHAAGGSVATDTSDPLAPREGGIYYYDETGPSPKLVLLEPTVYRQAKSGGFFKSALTYGIAKIKSKAVLNGAHAQLQLTNRKPTFYFYFEVTGSGLSGSGAGYFNVATTANEFILARPETKKSSRELLVGEMSVFGSQGGVQDESIAEFDFEKIAPGVYKVVPKQELEEGEYCFFYGGSAPVVAYGVSAGGGKVFDFGVRSK